MEYQREKNARYFLLMVFLISFIMSELYLVHNLYEIINKESTEFPMFEITLITSITSIFYYFILKIWKFDVIGYFFHSKIDYCIAYTPLLIVNFTIFFSNIIKYHGVDELILVLIYTIVFIILIYKSRALVFLTELFRLLGVTIYCVIGHYNLELFAVKLPYVLVIMAFINIILPVIWNKFWPELVHFSYYYYVNNKLLQYLLLVSKLKRSKIYIKIIIYSLLITIPIILTRILEIPMLGIVIVLSIMIYNKLAIENYCLITRNPWLFLKSMHYNNVPYDEKVVYLKLYGKLISELEYYGMDCTHAWQIKLMISLRFYISKMNKGGEKLVEEKEFAEDLILIMEDHPGLEFLKFQTKMQGLIANSPSIFL